MNNIAIYGVGGLGREVACLIRQINELEPQWNVIGFFDDNPVLKGKRISHFGPCLGGIEELNVWKQDLAVVLAISDPVGRKQTYDKIANPRVSFPNLIHPDFMIFDRESFSFGKGNIIQSGCSASCDVRIGNFNILNGGIIMGHDVSMDSYNSLMPTTRLSGGVKIGNCNYFGAGSIVIPGIEIENHVKLGAGSVLMTRPKEGNLYLGVPALLTVL